MTGRILADVRAACREVARRARSVTIVDDTLKDYARELSAPDLRLPRLDPRCHLLGRGRDTAAFMLALEAINFGSAYFAELQPYQGLRDYFGVAAALRDRFAAQVPTAEELGTWTWQECALIFGQDGEHERSRELMILFAASLNEIGRHVVSRYGGGFDALIEAADHSAERLVTLLIEMPGFADIASYGELRVPLLKRAQIASADLSLAFEGRELGRFDDLDRLTSFADDLMPHVLRTEGILRYAPGLADAIAREQPLLSGSEEEVEIRASAIEAVERIVAELRAAGRPATAMQVDYLLWNRGLEPRYQQHPRHRTHGRHY